MFDFNNCSTKSKYYDNWNKSVVGKIKDETSSIATEEFVGLNSKMYSLLVNDKSEYKRAKGMDKNVVATVSHNECKDHSLSQ